MNGELSELKEYFSTANACRQELTNIHKTYSTISLTKEEWHEMENTLAIMYLHCPSELCPIVLRTIEEMISKKQTTTFKEENK